MDVAFFDYRQNNSGGGFNIDEDKGISVHVVIEADSAEEANSKAEAIGLYFGGHGDCQCCGDRWYAAYDDDGDPVPSIYGDPISDYDFEAGYGIKWNATGPEAFVHFADGLIQGYGLPKKQLG